MADENKIRDAADAVKGIVEAVPVYQDALQPAAKEIGAALQKVTKAIHVALAPISALVWGYEKIAEYLDKTLAERLSGLPPEQIVTPNPAVAGPVVEALRFTAHDPSLRELYAVLLATAMNAETMQLAHPAFVEILRQLAPDEARLLRYLFRRISTPDSSATNQKFGNPAITGTIRVFGSAGVVRIALNHFSLIPRESGCTYPILATTYIENLSRLGLIEKKRVRDEGFESLFSPLMTEAKNFACSAYAKETGVETEMFLLTFEFDCKPDFIDLTLIGEKFCYACISDYCRTNIES
jgi:hypothetical protein